MIYTATIFNSQNQHGHELAVTAEYTNDWLTMGLESVPPGHATIRSLNSPWARIHKRPPRNILTPEVHFVDQEYPRIAAARRMAGTLITDVLGNEESPVTFMIEPLGLRQSHSRVIIESTNRDREVT